MGASAAPAVRALPGSYYHDPEIFARTREALFFKTWQFACHESRIPEPGDYFAFSILDQDLVVVRQKDRSVRGFYNVCQHRGHTLVEEAGRVRFLVCPYHAWTYDLDGRLRNAPGTRELPGFDATRICLTGIRLDRFCGFLFVNLDPTAAPMAELLPGVENTVKTLCPDIEARVLALEHDALERCNWLIAIENYNECYHCKVAHHTFSSGVVDPKSYAIQVLSDAARCLHHTALAQRGMTAWYDTSGSDYGSFFLWPTFSLQIYPSGLVNTYHWRPLGVQETQVLRGWYSKDGVVDVALQRVIELDRDTTLAEDLKLVARVQRGLASRGYHPGPLVINPDGGIDSEHSVATLHEWFQKAIDG